MSAAAKRSIYVNTIRLNCQCSQDLCKQYWPVCIVWFHLSAFQVRERAG